MAKERLQKILARAGLAASRRKAEELIREGSVTINGKPAKIGDSAEFGRDAIKFKGKLIHSIDAPAYYAFYKPKEMISAMSDPENRPTIAPLLEPLRQRLFPVERLDFMSDGLILVTNDGALQERMQKQSAKIPRVYHVKIRGHIDAEMLRRLEKGAKLDGGPFVKPASVRQAEELANKSILEIVFRGVAGGLDLKSYFEAKGFLVERITRMGLGHLSLKGMRPGDLRPLEASQVDALFEQPDLLFKKLDYENRVAREKGRDPRGLKPPPRGEVDFERKSRSPQKRIVLPKPLGDGAGAPARSKSRLPALFEGAKPGRAPRGGDRDQGFVPAPLGRRGEKSRKLGTRPDAGFKKGPGRGPRSPSSASGSGGGFRVKRRER